jgi:uncharacterized protein
MSLYSDLDYSFEIMADGNMKLVTDLDSIKQGLETLFFTSNGKRVMDNMFGIGIESYLFEPLSEDMATDIAEQCMGDIDKYEPRIHIQEFNVHIDEDINAYIIDLKYRVESYEYVDGTFSFNTILLIK